MPYVNVIWFRTSAQARSGRSCFDSTRITLSAIQNELEIVFQVPQMLVQCLASVDAEPGRHSGSELGLGMEGEKPLFIEQAQQVGSVDGEFVNPLGGHRKQLWCSEMACQPDHHQHKASADQ
jgi:hypothetical protein